MLALQHVTQIVQLEGENRSLKVPAPADAVRVLSLC